MSLSKKHVNASRSRRFLRQSADSYPLARAPALAPRSCSGDVGQARKPKTPHSSLVRKQAELLKLALSMAMYVLEVWRDTTVDPMGRLRNEIAEVGAT